MEEIVCSPCKKESFFHPASFLRLFSSPSSIFFVTRKRWTFLCVSLLLPAGKFPGVERHVALSTTKVRNLQMAVARKFSLLVGPRRTYTFPRISEKSQPTAKLSIVENIQHPSLELCMIVSFSFRHSPTPILILSGQHNS